MMLVQGALEKRIRISPEEKRLIDRLILPMAVTRTTLAQQLAVSPAWITKTLTPLMARGIIEEIGPAARSGGRRAQVLGISPQIGYLLGIDYGATSLQVTLAGPDITVIDQSSISLAIDAGPEAGLLAFQALADDLLAENGLRSNQIRGIGMGFPGPVDFSRGRLISPPLMPGWDDFPIAERVSAWFPSAYILVDNDVNLMALGASRQGEGQDVPNFIFIKIGSGIGAGIVCDGVLYRGGAGCAGDVGHIIVRRDGPLCHCGNRGCVEALAGGLAIARQATTLAESGQSPLLAERLAQSEHSLTAVDVGAAAAQGDLAALQLVDQSGQYVGEMLTHLVSFFNPDLILIGGGVSQIGHRFLNAIRQAVLKHASPLATRDLRITYSRLGDQAASMGALSLAQSYLFCVSTGPSSNVIRE